jgi:hypothetical protein
MQSLAGERSGAGRGGLEEGRFLVALEQAARLEVRAQGVHHDVVGGELSGLAALLVRDQVRACAGGMVHEVAEAHGGPPAPWLRKVAVRACRGLKCPGKASQERRPNPSRCELARWRKHQCF